MRDEQAFTMKGEITTPEGYSGGEFFHPGMTLRDYFAGQALAGITTDVGRISNNSNVAKVSYSIADAMLKERDVGKEK